MVSLIIAGLLHKPIFQEMHALTLFSIWLTLLPTFPQFNCYFSAKFGKWDLLCKIRNKWESFQQFGPHEDLVEARLISNTSALHNTLCEVGAWVVLFRFYWYFFDRLGHIKIADYLFHRLRLSPCPQPSVFPKPKVPTSSDGSKLPGVNKIKPGWDLHWVLVLPLQYRLNLLAPQRLVSDTSQVILFRLIRLLKNQTPFQKSLDEVTGTHWCHRRLGQSDH